MKFFMSRFASFCTYIGNWYVKLKAYTRKNWFMHHEWLWQDVHTKSKSRKIDKKYPPSFHQWAYV